MKKNLPLISATIILMFLVLILLSITINLKNIGIKTAQQKAIDISLLVKHSLTTQMVTDTISKREIFLEQIKEIKNIENIWITRSEILKKQFGEGFRSENNGDKIDKEVLLTGIEKNILHDSWVGKNTLRYTIPYKAESTGKINCMACHNAKEGDVLGSISVVLNIDDIKTNGVETVISVSILSFFIVFFLGIFIYFTFSPFIKSFKNIKNVMKFAEEGNYSKRVDFFDNEEVDDVSTWVNNLLNKIEKSLKTIESNMKTFMKYNMDNEQKDILLNVEQKSEELKLLYNFKKTIERDFNVIDIYNRIEDILLEYFKISDFSIIEFDNEKKINNVIIEHPIQQTDDNFRKNFVCRAYKTNNIVDSSDFIKICNQECRQIKNKLHLCIPYNITKKLSIILTLKADNEEEFNRIKSLKYKIENFIEISKTEIINKKLLEELKLSSKTDGLTNLYNRKFLDDKIKLIEKEVTRVDITYGILMIDIDYFKEVNDNYGHDIGDKTILTMAETLLENTRDTDYIIRYGGEEFLVILWNCDKNKVHSVAEKIREQFNKKKIIRKENEYFYKTTSIGYSYFSKDTENFREIIKYADIALYQAKHTGRNKSVVFDKSMI